MKYEEVRVVMMLPCPENPSTKIQISQIDEKEEKKIPPPSVPSLSGVNLPPTPLFGGVAIPMPPPRATIPLPGAGGAIPMPPSGGAIPFPSSGSIPLPPSAQQDDEIPKFPFSV
jgi:hypothetical protein